MREAADANQQGTAAAVTATEAQEDQAQSAERLQQIMRDHQQGLMQNAFYVHRLAEGFKDLSLGGRAASQGLMDISESLQYMLPPQMAIYAAIVQVIAMVGFMVEAHHRGGEAAREQGEAEKSAAETASAAFALQVSQYKDGVSSMIEGQAALLKSQQESTTEIGKQAGMMKAQMALDKEAALLKLQAAYTQAITMADPEQRERIERRYKAGRADIEDATGVNIANLEAQEATAKAKAAQDKLNEQESELAANTKALADARAHQAEAEEIFTKYGVIPAQNEKGEETGALASPASGVAGVPFSGKAASGDVLGDLKKEIPDLLTTRQSLKNYIQERSGLEPFATALTPQQKVDVSSAKQKLDATEKQLAQDQAKEEDLRKAQELAAQAQSVLGDSELKKKIQDAPAEMFQSQAEVNDAQDQAGQKAQAASQAQQAADLTAKQRKVDDDRAEALQKQELILKGISDQLEAQKTTLETKRDNPTASGIDKAAADQKIGQIENQLRDVKDQFENWKAGHGAPLAGPAEKASQNPYDGFLAAMTKVADNLQQKIDSSSGLQRQSAQSMLDALRGISRINGISVESKTPTPGTIPYVQSEWQKWHNANAQSPGAPSADQEEQSAARSLQTAQDAQTTQSAITKAHSDMAQSIKGMAETSGRVVGLVGDLADTTREAHANLAARISRVEGQVKAARINAQN